MTVRSLDRSLAFVTKSWTNKSDPTRGEPVFAYLGLPNTWPVIGRWRGFVAIWAGVMNRIDRRSCVRREIVKLRVPVFRETPAVSITSIIRMLSAKFDAVKIWSFVAEDNEATADKTSQNALECSLNQRNSGKKINNSWMVD